MTVDLPLVLPLVAPVLLRSVDPVALSSGGGVVISVASPAYILLLLKR